MKGRPGHIILKVSAGPASDRRRRLAMPRVEIYSAWNCPYCLRAKRVLRSKGVRFEVHEIWLVFFWIIPTARYREMVRRSGGRDSVPQVFVDGRHLRGCDDLVELDRRGELDALLGLSVEKG